MVSETARRKKGKKKARPCPVTSSILSRSGEKKENSAERLADQPALEGKKRKKPLSPSLRKREGAPRLTGKRAGGKKEKKGRNVWPLILSRRCQKKEEKREGSLFTYGPWD